MKIGMYSSDEIYDELANGFLHHSMVDAMYFEIKKLREENQQLKKQKDDVVEYIKKNKYKQYAGGNEFTCEIQYTDYVIKADDLLRMLGEIENE